MSDDSNEWSKIKEAVTKKVKDIDANILTNILVISTVGKNLSYQNESKLDLFEGIETEVILKMKIMTLSDLINLLWSV